MLAPNKSFLTSPGYLGMAKKLQVAPAQESANSESQVGSINGMAAETGLRITRSLVWKHKVFDNLSNYILQGSTALSIQTANYVPCYKTDWGKSLSFSASEGEISKMTNHPNFSETKGFSGTWLFSSKARRVLGNHDQLVTLTKQSLHKMK